MLANLTPTPFHSGLALVIAIAAAGWWLTVPGVMAISTFFALCLILAASGWVVMSTFENARPASSLAQSLHDERAAPVKPVHRR